MKNILMFLISLMLFSISCQINAESVETNLKEINNELTKINFRISPTSKSETKKQNSNSKIGNAEVGDKCIRFFIENSQLKVGDKVQIVFPEDSPQKISQAEIIETSECKEEPFGELSGNNPEASLTEYLLKLSNKNDMNQGFGIGIVNTSKKIKVINGMATIDINNDKKNEYFRECTSSEGLHMSVWTGRPLKGKRIWHSYYHFDYDTEPNCKDKELKDI